MIASCPFNLIGPANRVLWEVTSRCNMKCDHCLYYTSRSSFYGNDISTESVLRIVRQIELDGTIDQVWLSGGEPLIRHDLLQIASEITRAGMKPSVSTNGYLLSPNIATGLKDAGVRYVHLSIDGANAHQHDRFRNMEGSFDRVLNAADYLSMVGIAVGATCIVTRKNISDLKDVVRLALSHKIKTLSFYMAERLGRGKELIDKLDVDLMRDLRKFFFHLKDLYGRQIRLELFRTVEGEHDILDECRCYKFYTITNDGRLGGCPWLMKTKKAPQAISLETMTFTEARMEIEHELESLVRQRREKMSRCVGCSFKSTCGRGCIALSEGGTDPLCVKIRNEALNAMEST